MKNRTREKKKNRGSMVIVHGRPALTNKGQIPCLYLIIILSNVGKGNQRKRRLGGCTL